MRTLHTIKREKAEYTAEWAKWDNDWHHIVLNTGNSTIFVDGNLVGTTSNGIFSSVNEQPFEYDIFSDVDE